MAFNYFQLPRGIHYPFPPDDAQSFISEWYALQMTPIYEDAMERNKHQPPTSPQFRLYKQSMDILYNPSSAVKGMRQLKMEAILERLKDEVNRAKKKFIQMFVAYNQAVRSNESDSKRCREESLMGLKTFKKMVGVQRKHTKANHTLLFIKDAMEEAVETYREAEEILRKAGRESMWESPERIQNRFSKLLAVKKKIEEHQQKEIASSMEILDEMYQIQQTTIEKHTLLLAKARYLARLIQDADDGLLKMESEEVRLKKMNERVWRDYSLINMTIYDLTRGIVELRDLSPHLLEASLPQKLELVGREHGYNRAILRLWGKRRRAGDGDEEACLGPGFQLQRTARLRADWEAKLARLGEVVRKYRGRPLPKKIATYLAWMRRKNPQFPEPEALWAYLSQLVEEGQQNTTKNDK